MRTWRWRSSSGRDQRVGSGDTRGGREEGGEGGGGWKGEWSRRWPRGRKGRKGEWKVDSGGEHTRGPRNSLRRDLLRGSILRRWCSLRMGDDIGWGNVPDAIGAGREGVEARSFIGALGKGGG